MTSLSPKTLARLNDKGKLEGYSLPSGHRRYSRADVLRLTGAEA